MPGTFQQLSHRTKLATFIADDAETALACIERELGADAMVVSVRPIPAQGLARLWNRHRKIEVVAGVPDAEVAPTSSAPMAESIFDAVSANPLLPAQPRAWQSINHLERCGLIRECADYVEAKASSIHGATPPASIDEEWLLIRSVLKESWRRASSVQAGSGRPHVLIGPPGSGKTTALCKWMTRAVLADGFKASAWRLDANIANVSEFFSLHCEMIGVPVERVWSPPIRSPGYIFIDLPGTDFADPLALQSLREQLAQLPEPHVHLVLNAACENAILFKQFQAFADFNPEDLIFTHLDEVSNRVKLWNFVLGTNCSLRFLSAGQKIPGEFFLAEPQDLLLTTRPL